LETLTVNPGNGLTTRQKKVGDKETQPNALGAKTKKLHGVNRCSRRKKKTQAPLLPGQKGRER